MHSPGRVQSWLQRRDLRELDWKNEAISSGLVAAPFGAFWAVSHGFWFATPARAVLKGILVKGGAFAYQGSTVLAARFRHENDSLNQAVGGFIAGNLAGLASILAVVAAAATEAGVAHHARLSKPFDPERRLPGFLAVPNDPFAARMEQLRHKQE
ncbi:hypothetical protein HDV03_002808 [Kappamyces sp. JEL0829]|nr:hypothetical protein HDV03_002808 [Kappamyces sp. JEL0829]